MFFDIDGTLLSEKTGLVPDSAKQAIKEARKRGHLVFINTGRVYPHTRDIRSEIETDGCLCGCGTYVIAEGRVLYCYQIPHERGLQIKKDIDECGLDGALEGVEGCYLHRTVSRFPQVEELKAALRRSGAASRYDWEDDCYDFSKFYLASDEKSRPRELFGRLKDIEAIDRVATLEHDLKSSFFGPDKIPAHAITSGEKYPTINDVVQYVKWQNATGSLFDDDTATSCMSFYGLCE